MKGTSALAPPPILAAVGLLTITAVGLSIVANNNQGESTDITDTTSEIFESLAYVYEIGDQLGVMTQLLMAAQQKYVLDNFLERMDQYGEHFNDVVDQLSKIHDRQIEMNPGEYARIPDSLFDFYSDHIESIIDILNERVSIVGGELSRIAQDVNDLYTSATNLRLYDPLTLDLDGDGIETLSADGSVLFDHNGDGVKQGTGWIAPDDGLLVLDRNGNGLIDNGSELFGDNTTLNNGQSAEHGFAALSDLDSNGDGQFDAEDAQFADVKVWRDLNTDGISQPELNRSHIILFDKFITR